MEKNPNSDFDHDEMARKSEKYSKWLKERALLEVRLRKVNDQMKSLQEEVHELVDKIPEKDQLRDILKMISSLNEAALNNMPFT